MPRIWVINYRGQDLNGVEKFGDVKILSVGILDIFHPQATFWVLRKTLDAEAQRGDYLLPLGPHIITTLCGAYFLERFGECHFLLWNAKTREYFPRTITKEILKGVI